MVTPAAIIPTDPNFRWPEIYQINAGFQQQLGSGFAFSASYVASLARKLPIEWDINYPQFNVTSAGLSGPTCSDTTMACSYANTGPNANNRRPFNAKAYGATANSSASNPVLSTISQIQSSEGANYNGLQVSLQKTLSHGFSAQGFYVWSKSLQSQDMDTAGNTGNSATTETQDPNNRWLDRQRSDFDQRHVVAFSIVWKPNYNIGNRAMRFLVNGWTATTIVRLQSGNPFNITTGSDNNGDGVTNDRPNLMPGLTRAKVTDNGHSRSAMIKNWVNPTQFCVFGGALNGTFNGSSYSNPACPQQGAGPAGSDGTLRQNALDGPGRRAIDASLFRDFRIHERVTFQLRGESTNVFNLTNLSAPQGSLSSATFGQVTNLHPGWKLRQPCAPGWRKNSLLTTCCSGSVAFLTKMALSVSAGHLF